MRFDFYLEADSGSPSFRFIPPTLQTRGLGGAENGLVGLTNELGMLGHEVHVWNTPIDDNGNSAEGTYAGIHYHDANDFDPYSQYDIFVCFRNPFFLFPYIRANQKLWWSTDQVTCGNYGEDIKPFADASICISPYHRQYHIDTYGFDPNKIFSIDLGVNLHEYNDQDVAKVPNRLLYCSVPSRGLEYLKDIFPRIRRQVPDAELYITSDFSIWGYGIGKHNEEYVEMFRGTNGVHFVGKVPRQELVRLQLSSDLLVYPNAPSAKAHAELFGVSLAEAQVAGCLPITSRFGAFETTVIQPEGYVMGGHPSQKEYQDWFVHIATLLLKRRPVLRDMQNRISKKARARFNWNNIANQWLDVIQRQT